MGHEGKPLSLHGIAAFPQALDFLTAQWAVCFTRMHVDLICRLEAPAHINSCSVFQKHIDRHCKVLFTVK